MDAMGKAAKAAQPQKPTAMMPQKAAVSAKAAPVTMQPAKATPPPQPAAMPAKPSVVSAGPKMPMMGKGMGKGAAGMYQQAMDAYLVGGMNLSVKGCIEGQGAVCSLLQKGCAMAKTYGMEGSSPEEGLLCQSVATVCPQQLDGFDIAASICLQKTVHVCDAVPQICEALAAEDPAKGAACVQAFQSLCPMVGK